MDAGALHLRRRIILSSGFCPRAGVFVAYGRGREKKMTLAEPRKRNFRVAWGVEGLGTNVRRARLVIAFSGASWPEVPIPCKEIQKEVRKWFCAPKLWQC
jgi:hypothetical protein